MIDADHTQWFGVFWNFDIDSSRPSNTRPALVVTPLEGLRAALGEDVTVDYDDGTEPARAAALADRVDAVVLIASYTHADEGEYIPPGR